MKIFLVITGTFFLWSLIASVLIGVTWVLWRLIFWRSSLISSVIWFLIVYNSYSYTYSMLSQKIISPNTEVNSLPPTNEQDILKDSPNIDIIWIVKDGKCLFQWKMYQLPTNAICTGESQNAWKCNNGYKEIENNCYKQYLSSNGSCAIKWNISFNSTRKVYHLPEDQLYDSTIIDSRYGEKYFCTEYEAIQAGWKRSGI